MNISNRDKIQKNLSKAQKIYEDAEQGKITRQEAADKFVRLIEELRETDTESYNALQNTLDKVFDAIVAGDKKTNLPQGYKTESGRNLLDSEKDEFILKPDNSRDF